MKVFLAFSILAFTGTASAQWSYTGCEDVTVDDFDFTRIVYNTKENPGDPEPNDPSLAEPMKLDFDTDAGGNVIIYFIERRGAFKKYHQGQVSLLHTFDVFFERDPAGENQNKVEEGLTGIVLDPGFKENRYIYFSLNPAEVNEQQVRRYTLVGDVLQDEKILMRWQTQREDCCHTGGGLVFDDYGNLYIPVGNNTANKNFVNEEIKWQSDEWGASSTAGYRGGVLKIKPDNSPRGYSIPEMNFGEYYSQYFKNRGEHALAEQYLDTSLVLPEIYIKGVRSPFSIAVEPTKQWVAFGDVGPAFEGQTEEFNLFTKPEFAGWPYFSGGFVHSERIPVDYNTDPDNIRNTSVWNEGVERLPPVKEGTASYEVGCAITGSIYRYDPDLQSPVKFPPHFNNHWFTTDCNGFDDTRVYDVSEFPAKLGAAKSFVPDLLIRKPIYFKDGPDGAFYIIDYGSPIFMKNEMQAIYKVSYTGSCQPTDTPKLPRAGCMLAGDANFDPNANVEANELCAVNTSLDPRQASDFTHLEFVHKNGAVQISVKARAAYQLTLRNLKGAVLRTFAGSGSGNHSFRPAGSGMIILEFTSGGRRNARRLVLF